MPSLKIRGTGTALPAGTITGEEAHRRCEASAGRSIDPKFFVKTRRRAISETASELAAEALRAALKAASLSSADLDLLISVNSMAEQPIPTNAVLIHRHLGLVPEIPAFDLNATCTGFLSALNVANSFLAAGTYRRIGIVAADLGSRGINWKIPEVAALFGDGAAAAVVEADDSGESRWVGGLTRIYTDGAAHCEIRAGGNRLNFVTPPADTDDYLFQMRGKEVYKLAAQILPGFLRDLYDRTGVPLDEVDWVVPHQASPLALSHLAQSLGFGSDRLVNIIQEVGNQVSASLPTALDHLCRSGRLRRGQNILLIGTGAGLIASGVILRY